MSTNQYNHQNTTITAIATPQGSGGVAIIRLSGPDAFVIAQKATGDKDISKIPLRAATLCRIYNSEKETVDQAVITKYKAPASFTGEDVVEFAVHGSIYIQQELLQILCHNGAEPAGPGEFSQRAFLNSKIDLTQAEAIADIIAAESKAAHRLAITQMEGGLSKEINILRQQLIDLASLLELELDFSEEDVNFADREKLLELTSTLIGTISDLTSTYKDGQAFKNGIPVAIIGAPNAGKSTLLNALLKSERAIVSEIPGTTRDTIESTLTISGILFRLTDTAGIRETEDQIERLGIKRTTEAVNRAEIILRLTPPGAERVVITADTDAQQIIDIRTKSDLITETNEHNELSISALTGEGIEQLRELLVATATKHHNPQDHLLLTNARHYKLLVAAHESLLRVKSGIETMVSADFIAQDLREATHLLGELTGQVSTTDLLHTIFSRFCVGK